MLDECTDMVVLDFFTQGLFIEVNGESVIFSHAIGNVFLYVLLVTRKLEFEWYDDP